MNKEKCCTRSSSRSGASIPATSRSWLDSAVTPRETQTLASATGSVVFHSAKCSGSEVNVPTSAFSKQGGHDELAGVEQPFVALRLG